MCLICEDLIKQKMTLVEAERNAREMAFSNDHIDDLYRAIRELNLDELDKLTEEGISE